MCTIYKLANHFGLKQFYISKTSIKRSINVIEVDRPGLEMTGFFEYHQKDRLILLGRKEEAYLKNMSYEEARKVFLEIINKETPGVIICHGVNCPEVIYEVAKIHDCAIYGTELGTSEFEADALTYLSEQLAPKTSIHGNLLEVFGEGVLLIGPSGIGKSEVCLDLIKKGHRLVSDDKVEVRFIRDKLVGSAPSIIYGMMEVRGIGFIDVPRMFGINSLEKRTKIKYCVKLVPYDAKLPIDRLGLSTECYEILGTKIPLVTLPVSPARSMSEIIEVAVTNFKLKEYGYDTAANFERRLSEFRNNDDDQETED